MHLWESLGPIILAAISMTDSARIDRWLFHSRLFKSRSLAAEAVTGGRVHVNGERVKPARALRVGDRVSFTRVGVEFECQVLQLPDRRGPATAARQSYEESEASRARSAQHAENMRIGAAISPRPDGRPDRHGRRELRRMRGRE
jgi:ribosome-associated heat shock protein Hsp15